MFIRFVGQKNSFFNPSGHVPEGFLFLTVLLYNKMIIVKEDKTCA